MARAAQAGRDRLIRLDRSQARSLATLLARSRAKLDGQAKLLQTLGYHNVLSRGFALVRGEDGAMLRRAAEVKPGSALDIEFADGHIEARADAAARKPEPERRLRAGAATTSRAHCSEAMVNALSPRSCWKRREQAGVARRLEVMVTDILQRRATRS